VATAAGLTGDVDDNAVRRGGRDLRLVRRLTHSMRVSSGPFGAAVTVTMKLSRAAAGV